LNSLYHDRFPAVLGRCEFRSDFDATLLGYGECITTKEPDVLAEIITCNKEPTSAIKPVVPVVRKSLSNIRGFNNGRHRSLLPKLLQKQFCTLL